MVLNLTNISSIDKCDAYIQQFQFEKQDFQSAITRYANLASQRASVVDRTQTLLTAVDARIATLETKIANEPDANVKLALNVKLNMDLARKGRYEITLGDANSELDVERQFNQSEAEAMIVNLDERITALQARKVEIQNAA